MSLYPLRVNLMNGFKPEKGKSQGFVWRLKTITGEHELNCIMNQKQKAKLLFPQLTLLLLFLKMPKQDPALRLWQDRLLPLRLKQVKIASSILMPLWITKVFQNRQLLQVYNVTSVFEKPLNVGEIILQFQLILGQLSCYSTGRLSQNSTSILTNSQKLKYSGAVLETVNQICWITKIHYYPAHI